MHFAHFFTYSVILLIYLLIFVVLLLYLFYQRVIGEVKFVSSWFVMYWVAIVGSV